MPVAIKEYDLGLFKELLPILNAGARVVNATSSIAWLGFLMKNGCVEHLV